MLSLEPIKLLGSAKKDVDKDNNGKDVPKLESVKVVLVHCKLVNNCYQQASKVLFTFVPNNQFGQLINIAPHPLTMLKTTRTEFQSIKLKFTDQKHRPLEVEDNVNITLILGRSYKNEIFDRTKYRKYVKGYGFLSFQEKLVTNW